MSMSEKLVLVVDAEEHAAIMAGLRLLEKELDDNGGLLPTLILDVHTAGGDVGGLDQYDVDDLAIRVNQPLTWGYFVHYFMNALTAAQCRPEDFAAEFDGERHDPLLHGKGKFYYYWNLFVEKVGKNPVKFWQNLDLAGQGFMTNWIYENMRETFRALEKFWPYIPDGE